MKAFNLGDVTQLNAMLITATIGQDLEHRAEDRIEKSVDDYTEGTPDPPEG